MRKLDDLLKRFSELPLESQSNAIITTPEIAEARLNSNCWLCGASTKRECPCHAQGGGEFMKDCHCPYKAAIDG